MTSLILLLFTAPPSRKSTFSTKWTNAYQSRTSSSSTTAGTPQRTNQNTWRMWVKCPLYLSHVRNISCTNTVYECVRLIVFTPLGEKAAHRPLCKLPGRGAEGCGPWSGAQPHLLRVCQRGAQLPHAACTGHARNRWCFRLCSRSRTGNVFRSFTARICKLIGSTEQHSCYKGLTVLKTVITVIKNTQK